MCLLFFVKFMFIGFVYMSMSMMGLFVVVFVIVVINFFWLLGNSKLVLLSVLDF